MLDKKVSKLLNEQINNEFYSAYLYLDFANYFEAKGLDGFANWYKIQAQEERDHAMLFYQFLQNNSEKVTLEAIGKPDKVFACDIESQFLRVGALSLDGAPIFLLEIASQTTKTGPDEHQNSPGPLSSAPGTGDDLVVKVHYGLGSRNR